MTDVTAPGRASAPAAPAGPPVPAPGRRGGLAVPAVPAPGPGRRGLLVAALLAPVLGPALAACSNGNGAVGAPRTSPALTAQPALATTSTVTPPAAGATGTTGTTRAIGAAGTTGTAVVPAPADGSGGGSAGASGQSSASGSATVGLMPGFPTDLVPVPAGATVTASAVRRSGGRLDVSLSGTTSQPEASVLAFYDNAFRARGFTAAGDSTIAPGTGGRVYARGDEVVVVAAHVAGRSVSFSVGGTVRA